MSKVNHQLSSVRGVVFDVDGVLSPATVPMDENGVPLRMVNIKDGYALQLAVKCGLRVAIITGGVSEAIRKRYTALGITDIFMGAAQKTDVLNKWLADAGMGADEVAYCGDDIPDLPCMQIVGLPVAPADAAPEIKAAAKYITVARGGYGVARELIEQILRANGQWLSDTHAFGW